MDRYVVVDLYGIKAEDRISFWRNLFEDATKSEDIELLNDDFSKGGPNDGTSGYIALGDGGITLSHDPTEKHVSIMIHTWGKGNPDRIMSFVYDVLEPKDIRNNIIKD